mmetsp:Transcript_21220/g.59704  ORF Transcript_21220/g.59704 Transcript_21220/m.59704 type:complete len:133 (+) Transcript_21220:78-476(+)|eukprot:CAMPEP_0179316272 /NCGR_PEP_ID=MMETSP0797-20121207/55579_1 /TAXON_ID=47934 /ORGANISM="Dinophysis acuminata, Strain DAEP01" /LENGTH=132 /DNA_ID=CAMNT_0021026997 /DNA_START=78 /DNA_END=476 /DNA_ORIENTATION=+
MEAWHTHVDQEINRTDLKAKHTAQLPEGFPTSSCAGILAMADCEISRNTRGVAYHIYEALGFMLWAGGAAAEASSWFSVCAELRRLVAGQFCGGSMDAGHLRAHRGILEAQGLSAQFGGFDAGPPPRRSGGA